MNSILTAAAAVNSLDEEEKTYVINEGKFAILGAVLFVLLSMSWVDSLISNVFPAGKGPMITIYKIILFIALFYIIQKSDWFQSF